jgi:cell division transport system permease protein
MEEKSTKRHKPSALPSILSLTAVMFFLGLLGTSIIGFKGLGKLLMESSSIDIYFNDSIPKDEVLKFKTQIDKLQWVKSSTFISREEGMKQDKRKKKTGME